MTSSILNITFDCADAARLCRSWAAVTGWDARAEDSEPGHEEYSAGPDADGGVRL